MGSKSDVAQKNQFPEDAHGPGYCPEVPRVPGRAVAILVKWPTRLRSWETRPRQQTAETGERP